MILMKSIKHREKSLFGINFAIKLYKRNIASTILHHMYCCDSQWCGTSDFSLLYVIGNPNAETGRIYF